MISIVFVCHGNICRSPMAEFVLKDMVRKAGLDDGFHIESRATSTEEIGNPVHRGTRRKLAEFGISVEGKYAEQLRRSDYGKFDLIIVMDSANVRNTMRIIGSDPDGKLHKLNEYSGRAGDIADPWYTDDFDATYDDVYAGCEGLLKMLTEAYIRK